MQSLSTHYALIVGLYDIDINFIWTHFKTNQRPPMMCTPDHKTKKHCVQGGSMLKQLLSGHTPKLRIFMFVEQDDDPKKKTVKSDDKSVKRKTSANKHFFL